jgi:hypothetical protein
LWTGNHHGPNEINSIATPVHIGRGYGGPRRLREKTLILDLTMIPDSIGPARFREAEQEFG